MSRYPPAAQRLNDRSVRQGDCLIYTAGHASRSGHVLMVHNGRSRGVHVIAWELVNGPVPDGLLVRHRCDVPRCIEIQHLHLGTVADNNRDRDSRGRHVALRGEANGFAKLNALSVLGIRLGLDAGMSQRSIARMYRVHQSTVWKIAHGVTWKNTKEIT